MDQRQIRIVLSIWAMAYERYNHSFVSDAEYDALSLKVDLSKGTGRVDLDIWFKEHYDPSTGMWVLGHPEAHKLRAKVEWLRDYEESLDKK